MKAKRDLDAFLAFLAGAGAGAALTRWYLGGAWPPFAVPSPEAQRQGATAASIGRIHSLLGEIRSLMRAPARGASEPAAGGTSAPKATGGPGPRMPESAPSAPLASAPEASGGPSATGEGASAAAGGRARPGDAWRRPDQIGYGRPPIRERLPGPGAAGAVLLAGAGAAAAYAMLRKAGASAAWAAAGGVVAASVWSAVRSGPGARPGAGPSGSGAWLDGRRGRRRGRPAVR